MIDTFKMSGNGVDEEFTRDELAALYHHSFYGSNVEQPLPVGHPPTPTMTGQMKLANLLGDMLPDAALQNFERALEQARRTAAQRQAARDAQQQQEAQQAEATATMIGLPEAEATAIDLPEPPAEAEVPQEGEVSTDSQHDTPATFPLEDDEPTAEPPGDV